MKPIIIVLFFLLMVVLLNHCEKESNSIKIPDTNLLNALIEQGVDTDGDGKISPFEAENKTYLDVSEDNISDMSGIEAFVYLDTLICNNNQLTSIDVTNNTNLLYLECGRNQLAILNIRKNTELEVLRCDNNQLTSLDVSRHIMLSHLTCSSNPLNSLDVTNNPALNWLGCNNTQLSTLDIANNHVLENLYCSHNQLASLDVSNNIALIFLYCPWNLFTSLDVSNNPDIQNFYINGMPSLYQVCVWEMPFPPTGVNVVINNSPNVYFTTNCSI